MIIHELKEKVIGILIAAIIMFVANLYTHSTTAVWYIDGDRNYDNTPVETKPNWQTETQQYTPNVHVCKHWPQHNIC